MAAEDGVDLHLRDGDHACILFGSDEEHRIVVAQFLADGLRSGQRVMNIACAHSPATMRSYLARAGADPERSEATGQLTILEGKDAYTPSGAFDPDAMVAMLTQTVAAAVAAGWNGMRGSGDMSWAADAPPGSDRIMEYEAKLNQCMPGSRFRALCQYDMRRFDPATLLGVLTTHPIVYVGTRRLENFYYMPPEEQLSGARPDAQLGRWLRNLEERQTAEERLRAEAVREERVRRMRTELAAKNAFLNTAAHELATPLTPVGLQVQVLKRAPPETPIGAMARNLAVLERGFERLRGIVGQLLDSVRAEGASLRIDPEPVDLRAVLAHACDAFDAPAAARGLRLVRDWAGPGVVVADADRLGQVVDNLVANAVKFTDPGGTVQVSLRASGAGFEVLVTDTGIGLTEEQAGRLFQPFSKVHDEHPGLNGGTGLGLFISRGIVERHGGRIWVESGGAGKGATFGFWLPSAGHEAPPAAPPAA